MLSVSHLTASYGVAQALFGVNFELADGEVTALMGRNGMGKTTTVKAICRIIPSQGGLAFDGQDLQVLHSHQAARLGLGLVPEGRRCFRDLTVTENLVAAARPGYWTLARVNALFPALSERAKQVAATLSGGEQQMLAIARALMTNPRLLILDEATEGLAPVIRQEIWVALAQLKSTTGLTQLVIDKSIKELSGICDKAVILERGKTVWNGTITALDDKILQKYVGV